MSSRIVIADGRKLSNETRDTLKREKGVELGYFTGTDPPRQDLYTIGERCAARRIPQNILDSMLPQARERVIPRFTIDISRGLLDSLDPNLPVYTTSTPSDIQTIGDLRRQMSEPGYTISYWLEVDQDRMAKEMAESARARRKGERTLAKKTLREIHGARWLRRLFYQEHLELIRPLN